MSIKKRKFDSVEKMLSFPKYITLNNDTLTLKFKSNEKYFFNNWNITVF